MLKKIYLLIIIFLIGSGSAVPQVTNYLGLADKHITSMKIGEGIIAVGTNFNGVYWQSLYQINDSSWNKIDFDSVLVTAVYPHKSGPIGWAIGIAARPDWNSTDFIFCSYLGEKPKSISYGIDPNNTLGVDGLDGFPYPTICGETFAIGGRKLYRRNFQDTIWYSVFNRIIDGSFECLKAREQFSYVFAGGGEGFANVLLARSSDKGETWEYLPVAYHTAEVDFWGRDDQIIFVTDRQKIMRSIDQGKTWENVFDSDSLTIQKMSFNSSGNTFFVIANNNSNYLFYTIDKGDNWTSIKLPIYDIVVGMDIDSEDCIYIATIHSGIFKISSLIVKVEQEWKNYHSQNFDLSDNYPNPFNPTTKIKYEIPDQVRNDNIKVQLKVYDIMGKEVATLVDEYKPAGKYETEFNAENFPSGVYLYRLQAGSFIDTKKMILLK